MEDILVNGHLDVYVSRHGVLERIPVRFADSGHLLRIVRRILAPIGRRLDESNPMVDARLPDGGRINVVIPRWRWPARWCRSASSARTR